MAVIKNNVKAQGMSGHISTWQQSGLSQAEYCRLVRNCGENSKLQPVGVRRNKPASSSPR